jgi:carbon storage regulator CsrA
MLYLTRKVGQSIVINDKIELTITEIKGKVVKIGFNFPANSTVLRKEIYDRIMEENKDVASSFSNEEIMQVMAEDDSLLSRPELAGEVQLEFKAAKKPNSKPGKAK